MHGLENVRGVIALAAVSCKLRSLFGLRWQCCHCLSATVVVHTGDAETPSFGGFIFNRTDVKKSAQTFTALWL